MAKLRIHVDAGLKREARAVAEAMGMDLPTAVRIFLGQMVREKGLPFRPTADPVYNAENVRVMSARLSELKSGKKTERHDLAEDE